MCIRDSPEYVYLLRMVVATKEVLPPNAKIPVVELPVAAPCKEPALAAVAEALVSPEYVYLFRVVDGEQAIQPNANIPVVEFPVAD